MNTAMNTDSLGSYYDFQQLAGLRHRAVAAPDQAVDEVAAHFESLFTQMMLQSMRDATIEGGLFDSQQLELYQSMLDQQVALHLSGQQALGLSEVLVEQLQAQGAVRPATTAGEAEVAPLAAVLSSLRRAGIGAAAATDTASATAQGGAAAAAAAAPQAGAWRPGSPEEFIRDVWEHAVAAGRRLGVEPAVLVAQSALETGWGGKVIRGADGRSSFNLFGIKADARWAGPTATVGTMEFRGGVAALEQASFRVYDSLSESFDDYVAFLSDNPRYRMALDGAADSRAFVQGLQDAGYATDPDYADKIMDIVAAGSHRQVFAELKQFSALPLNTQGG